MGWKRWGVFHRRNSGYDGRGRCGAVRQGEKDGDVKSPPQERKTDRREDAWLGGFGFGLEEFGELCDFFRLLDDVEGENVGGRGFLEFVAEGGGKLVEALDAFAEFLFVFEEEGAFGRGGGSGIR